MSRRRSSMPAGGAPRALAALLLALAALGFHGTGAAARQGGAGVVDVAAVVAAARADLQDHWFRQMGWRFLSAPHVVRIDVPTDTPCGREEEETAFYCRSTKTIYWDHGFLARHARLGDFVPVFILAHEWAHHVQNWTGALESNLLGIQIELQADCFAGQYTRDAIARGVRNEGDADEAVLSLRRSADDMDSPWWDAGAHGSPGQRIDAFEYGLAGRDCRPQGFWDFLATRGVDPTRVPQDPTPGHGALADRLPRVASRFVLGQVERMTVPRATDALQAVYASPNGMTALHTLTAFPTAAVASEVFTGLLPTLARQGMVEIKRMAVTSPQGQRLGTLVILRGPHEAVVWTNGAVLASIEGPVDVAWELYDAMPY